MSRQNVGFLHDPTMGEQPLHRLRGKVRWYLRDLSCLLLCSLRLNARAQNWHLYFLSGTCCDLAGLDTCATDAVAVAAAGIFFQSLSRMPRCERKRLSDSEASVSMDWTYAKRIALDHASWLYRRSRRRKLAGDEDEASVLSWLLV